MKYYYLHPGKPRYFFPKGFQQHPLFFSFCRPYSKKGRRFLVALSKYRTVPLVFFEN